jgi:hypothetical protein
VKFKLDENLPTELVMDLHQLGHNADTVTDEKLCGAPDAAVLQAANAAGRILLTLDKGIANLRRYPISEHAGVVLFRPDTLGRRGRSCVCAGASSKDSRTGLERTADGRRSEPHPLSIAFQVVSISFSFTGRYRHIVASDAKPVPHSAFRSGAIWEVAGPLSYADGWPLPQTTRKKINLLHCPY